MATLLGFSARTIFALESDQDAIKPYHIRVAEIFALEMVVERNDKSLAPERIAKLADDFAGISKSKWK